MSKEKQPTIAAKPLLDPKPVPVKPWPPPIASKPEKSNKTKMAVMKQPQEPLPERQLSFKGKRGSVAALKTKFEGGEPPPLPPKKR